MYNIIIFNQFHNNYSNVSSLLTHTHTRFTYQWMSVNVLIVLYSLTAVGMQDLQSLHIHIFWRRKLPIAASVSLSGWRS